MANYQKVYFLLISLSCHSCPNAFHLFSAVQPFLKKHISSNFYIASFSSTFAVRMCSVEVWARRRIHHERHAPQQVPYLHVPKIQIFRQTIPSKTRHLAGYRSKSDFMKPGILSQMQNHPEKSHPKSSRRLATHACSVISKKVKRAINLCRPVMTRQPPVSKLVCAVEIFVASVV